MNTYKVDFVANTITITAAFAKAMNDPTSAEYKIIAQIRKDFPEMEIIRKTHKTPSKYQTKTGEKFNCMEMSRNVQSGNTQNLKSSAAPVRLPAAPAPTPGTSQAAAPAGCAYRF